MGGFLLAAVGFGALWFFSRGSTSKTATVSGKPPPFDGSSSPNLNAPKVVGGEKVSDLLALLDELPADLRSPAIRAVVFADPDLLRARGEDLIDAGYGEIAERLLERADAISAMG